MKYLGDLTEDQVIDFKFSTHKADGTPITLAGTPVVKVYKANATDSEIATGVTLTVDFDGVTGLHNVRIDTSADAFYAIANDYSVVITTGTVDGVSVVGTVLATFSIENRFIEADVTKWRGTAPLALASQRVVTDVGAVSGDSTAADNLESAYDGTAATAAGQLYVSKSGNDANDGRSWQTAKLTIAGAIAACSGGETIHVGPGTYVENVDLTGSGGVTIKGAGMFATTVQPAAGFPLSAPVDLLLQDIALVSTALPGLHAGNFAVNWVLERVWVEGSTDAIVGPQNANSYIWMRDCYAKSSNFDGVVVQGYCRLERCYLETNGVANSGSALGSEVVTGKIWASDCHIVAKSAVTRTMNAARTAGEMILTNCRIESVNTGVGASSDVRGVYGESTAKVTVQGGTIKTSVAGSGTAYDILMDTGASAVMQGVGYDIDKVSGTVALLDPIVDASGNAYADMKLVKTVDADTAITTRVDASTLASDLQNMRNMSKTAVTSGTVNDATPTATSFITALTEATNDHYKNRIIEFTSGALIGQGREITGYNGVTKTITVNEAFTDSPANGDSFVILGYIAP